MSLSTDKVNDLIEGKWDELALYHLTPAQADSLLTHKGVIIQEGWLPAHYKFPEHAHAEAQLLLVTRGVLTHKTATASFLQKTNDLLVVPAKKRHTAIIGDEDLEFFVIVKGNG